MGGGLPPEGKAWVQGFLLGWGQGAGIGVGSSGLSPSLVSQIGDFGQGS